MTSVAIRRLRLLMLTALLVPTVGLAGHRHRQRDHWHSHPQRDVVFAVTRALPQRRLTPGALNPRVRQGDIRRTICVRGYTRLIRPPERYTERLKREQIRAYGYADHWLRSYEEDHLIPLELGGSPTSPRNLWPEPRHVAGGWGAHAKDRLEDRLHWLVCHRRIALAGAQRAIASDWIRAYRRFVRPGPRR